MKHHQHSAGRPSILTRSVGLALAVATTALGLVGCSGSEGQASPSSLPEVYRSQIERVLANPPNDFVADVLADYHVSDAEYREARQRLKECIEAEAPGLSVELPDSGGSSVGLGAEFLAQFASQNEAEDAASVITDGCGLTTTSDIETVYRGVRENPQGFRNYPEAVRACFDAAGAADGNGLSDDDLVELLMSEDPVLSPEAAACAEDPMGELERLDDGVE